MKTNDYPIFTQKDLSERGKSISNNLITKIDISVIAHFGNVVCLEAFHTNCATFSGHNDTATIGFMLKAIIETMGLSEEDGLRISEIKNIPCRIVSDGAGWGSKAIGFGHFMDDKFLIADDLRKWAMEKAKHLSATSQNTPQSVDSDCGQTQCGS